MGAVLGKVEGMMEDCGEDDDDIPDVPDHFGRKSDYKLVLN